MVSIKDVAKEAGVAISTVSKVLNNYPNVSESTRKKVMDVVDRLGFVPNAVAASLSSKRIGRVALLIKLNLNTQASDEISMQYISGAVHRAKELQLDVITVFTSMIDDMNVEEVTSYFESQGIKGIIVYGLTTKDKVIHKLIGSGRFKMVVVDAPMVNETTSSVSIDNKKAQYEIAKKTITENKCRKVLYLAGEDFGYVTGERLEGIKKLCEEKKLKLSVRNGNFSELRARQLTMRYAKNNDCVVCASDLMAIGAMKALIDMDIFRPVCGFDGIILMGYVGKQMNTVKQDFVKISEVALDELNRLMKGKEGRKVTVPHTLVRMRYEDIIS
ncbi:MAG: LacI family transcriptional regulator [Butyrivibrio sp.]|nr:LacI family transcriptional regulator [Butyrivibrio sp.]